MHTIRLRKLWGDNLIEKTLDEIYLAISEYNEKSGRKKNYNIFKVLEMTDREVLMCRVLTDFLNPEGAHGKGTKYLKIFLDKIIHRVDYERICASAHVFKEYRITGERRIDIVIESLDIFIPIEVKIHAEEQKSQCFDYYMYAKQKDNQPQIIYLTKKGTMPSSDSLCSADGKQSLEKENVLCISFAEDICHFMEMIINSEENWIIKEIAKQYCDAIKEFTVHIDEELQMEIVNKICENEQRFRSMLVIEQVAQKAKAKLIYDLMEEFELQMKPILERYGLEKESKFNWYEYKAQATERYYRQNESTYPGLNYVFSDIVLSNGIQLWFRIEVDNNLFAGICLFDTESKSEFNISDQDILLSGINLKEAQYEGWWVRYWYLPTAYDNIKMEGHKVPNFKNMNESAIMLSDKDKRKQFVKECMKNFL